METDSPKQYRLIEKVKERDKIGVWGFGNVSRDVFLSLVNLRYHFHWGGGVQETGADPQ